VGPTLQHIIHRDIKPENLLLTGDKTIKLADFGLAINNKDERPVTRAGTLDYMAPEVLLGSLS
jgi:aurora kinase